ncbi:MAG: iron ABC transporter permease [Chloroflexi bacterium]|nr:iron ABC transporter permease [Chloroflexota bacterium]
MSQLTTAITGIRARASLSTGRVFVILLLFLVGFLVLYPLVMLFFGSLNEGFTASRGNLDFHAYIKIYTDASTYTLLLRTLWLAIARTAIAVIIAAFLAWVITRTNVPFAGFLQAMIMFNWFMPMLPKILAWIILLQPKVGLVNQLLRTVLPVTGDGLNIYSYGGIIFVGSFVWIPILFIFLVPAFKAIDASLIESSRSSGASVWTTMWRVELPLLAPAMLAATALAFLRMVESFTPEALLGLPANIYVFTTKIYHSISKAPTDYSSATALAVTLLIITTATLIIQWKLLGKKQFTTITGRGFRAYRMDLGKWKWVVFAGVLLFIAIDLFVPMGVLIWGSFTKVAGVFMPDMYTFAHYKRAFSSAILMKGLQNTIVMGLAMASIGMILSSLIAYVVVKTRFKERRALDLLAYIPWAIPAMIMALGFLWAYIFLPLPFGIKLYGTLALMTMALIVKELPLGSRTMASTMVQLSNELEESSRVHGATWAKTFRSIVLPLLGPGFLAGWILLFAAAVKDLATVIVLYSSPSTVISTMIFGKWAEGQFEVAIVLGVIQALLIALAYFAMNLVSRKFTSSVQAG